ncbi:DNA repair protein NreA [Salinirussus salinus]|uniref:DNA repair protein NreA n=1 Tax=Salinirussus salinus TaxID=1198300 RepID=UPI001358D027|nr:DNA repair protein NreA [Salinirussus salinus]
MRLGEFIEDFERDEAAERRRLAREKSYEITDYLDEVERQFQETVQGDSLFGATAPEIFVGRSDYPNVSTGLLSPMDREADPGSYATGGHWYREGLDINDVLQRRTGLLNSTRSTGVDVTDVWDGFVGVQREVAIADHPVDVEVGLSDEPDLDLTLDDIQTPTGPRARATSADLAENPHVPRPVEKTLEDDDWQAEGAITYLYRRDFDVYDINTILSAGALGQGRNRRLVPTRWSITAVDDTVGQYLRGQVRSSPSVDEVQVWHNAYLGNDYWVVLAPGNWEFELVELKAPGSVWNPEPDGAYYMAADSESYEGRTDYVDETAGAYYATRLGVLEHLASVGRQATCLVVRHATEEYWAPVGVWQIREGIRDAFEGEPAVAESFHAAVRQLAPQLPVSLDALRRKSELVAGVQSQLTDF